MTTLYEKVYEYHLYKLKQRYKAPIGADHTPLYQRLEEAAHELTRRELAAYSTEEDRRKIIGRLFV